MKRLQRSDAGFTIIEVLIVLAIAGLIMLVVFLAVPALQRSQRDNRRKNAATTLLNIAETYRADHNNKFPFAADGVPDDATLQKFYDNYLKNTVLDGDYTLNILPRTGGSHSHIGPLNEISVTTGHWCNDRPHSQTTTDAGTGNPITGDGKRTTELVIWTKLEGGGGFFCVDNSTGTLE